MSAPCRWWDTKQRSWVAVKQLDGSNKLAGPEVQILRHVAAQEIPRTVATIDEERHGPNSIFVIGVSVLLVSLCGIITVCVPRLFTTSGLLQVG